MKKVEALNQILAEGDEATVNLLDDLINMQEQDRWTLKALLDE